MKTNHLNFYTWLILLFIVYCTTSVVAQHQDQFQFQAMALDANDRPILRSTLDVRMIITDGQNGTKLFEEDHTVTTNNSGIFSLIIGDGTNNFGSLSQITWNQVAPWLETQIDFGSGLQSLGSVPMVSVPYAKHAETATFVDDADADPTNEIQQLSLINGQLEISNGNSVDLQALASPWEPIPSGIEYQKGVVEVRDPNRNSAITMDGHSIGATFQGNSYELTPERIDFSRDVRDFGSNLDAVALDINNPSGAERTYITKDSIGLWAASCSTALKPGLIYMLDTTVTKYTSYSKDSLFYSYAATSLAIPDQSSLKGTGLSVKTPQLDLSSEVTSTKMGIYNFEENTQIEAGQVRLYNTYQITPKDRAVLKMDSLLMNNGGNEWNVELIIDSVSGGHLELSDLAGKTLVELGGHNDSLVAYPNSGLLRLMDDKENVRVQAGSFWDEGYLNILSSTHSTFLNPGGVAVQRRDSIDPQLDIIRTAGYLGTNADRQSGYFELYDMENPDDEILVRIQEDELSNSSGTICLFNETKDFEKVCLRSDNILGGELVLNSDFGTKFYAGGSADQPKYYLSNKDGLEILGGQINEFGLGDFFTNGSYLIRNGAGTILSEWNRDQLIFNDENGSTAILLAREINDPAIGLQYLYGKNGFANVYLGQDLTEGEILPSGNVGAVEVYDATAERRAWINGQGEVGGQAAFIENANHDRLVTISQEASTGDGSVQLLGTNGNLNVSMDGGIGNQGEIRVHDLSGTARAGIGIDPFSGEGVIWGDVKNFRMDHPEDKDKEIWYASLEGPEAGAYTRGRGQLKDGEIFITFPEHFQHVCNHSTITVQLTPKHWDTYGLAVIEITETGFFVKELKNGRGNFEFDWEAKGKRKGFEDFETIRNK